MTEYECIIGLETHVQLMTDSKIFCRCSTEYGAAPNSQVCPVCLGLPGALPVLNKKAVEYALRMVIATGGDVCIRSCFARKNYFYPDLPKGYQISQYDLPLGEGAAVLFDIDGETRSVRLTRIHLEEDAGKMIHGANQSYVDMNRCGVPLLEIVTEPDIRSPSEAYCFLARLKQTVRYLGICSGDMEKGALRCDANISVRPAGSSEFGSRTELKNLNSFRGVERALTYEMNRQIELIESGNEVAQETRLWNEDERRTHTMRSKEESHDYRYFKEPDLVDLRIDDDWIKAVSDSLPELPHDKYLRFQSEYGLSAYDAEILISEMELADYVDQVIAAFPNPKKVANWVMTEVLKALKDSHEGIETFRITPEQLAQLLRSVDKDVISGKIAKDVFAEMVSTGADSAEIIESRGLSQIIDEQTLRGLAAKVLAKNAENVELYRNGKTQLLGFFVGELMKATDGKASPRHANRIIRKLLDES